LKVEYRTYDKEVVGLIHRQVTIK